MGKESRGSLLCQPQIRQDASLIMKQLSRVREKLTGLSLILKRVGFLLGRAPPPTLSRCCAPAPGETAKGDVLIHCID